MIFIDEDKCTGCGDCLQVCLEEGAVVLEEEKAIINRELCTNCAACLPACSEGAIYEVETAPTVAPPAQPVRAERQTTLARAGPALVSTLAAAAPVALNALTGLARRWLEGRSVARRRSGEAESGRGGRGGPGAGGRHRRQRTRGSK
jgi:NAD-dependent dihydropyrimidine dehydrogenase PreA subunit